MGSSKIRKSRAGPWRAFALITVHVLIALHMLQWWYSGMADGRRETLTPVEPSESMWALERGLVNAGTVMFALAILATALFGRFFCGWLCHVVAVQDACAWLMKKFGIHPKPWRSRLLLYFPLGLAIYMFLWPTFRREVLVKLIGEQQTITNAAGVTRTINAFPPHLSWIGQPIAFPAEGLRTHFMTEDFWATFPPWYVAIPYFLVCGFAIVYFLGAKGFCTYGCPYGGFFGPVDRLAPVRIRVTDACNHCGHCTAVCTSNVRVSDEVHEYGAVVDPGCMKCMDCVSVCPNDALYVGLGAPAILTKARTSAAERVVRRAKAAIRYDLSIAEEIGCAIVMMVVLIGVRGTTLFDFSVPLLMAVGIAAVSAFLAFKLWRMVRDMHVRGPRVQLKIAGRVTLAGYAFILGAAALLVTASLGFVSQSFQTLGRVKHAQIEAALFRGLDAKAVEAKRQQLFTAAYSPDPAIASQAKDAIAGFQRADSFWRGGLGLNREWDDTDKLAWLQLVAGDATGAEANFRRVLAQRPPDDERVIKTLLLMDRRNAPPQEAEAFLRPFVTGRQGMYASRSALAGILSFQQRNEDAFKLYEQYVRDYPADVQGVDQIFNSLLQANQADRLRTLLPLALKARPKAAPYLAWTGALALFKSGDPRAATQADRDKASTAIAQAAATIYPDDFETMNKLAQLCDLTGKPDDAAKWRERAKEAFVLAGKR